jgi:hypothetical protein
MAAFKAGGGVVEIIECDGEDERRIGFVTAIAAERELRRRMGRRVRLRNQ